MRRLLYLSTIAADLGDIFFFIAPLTAVPLVVAVLFAEWSLFLPMATVPVVFFLLGTGMKHLPRNERENRLSTSLCSIALFWIACAMVSGLPFMFGLNMSFTDAVFEGMAGWTGTAFTMLPSVDTTPYTLLFWRTFMQWIGGIGIIAYVIALASSSGLFQGRIYRTESREEPLMPSIVSTGRAIWKIYGLLTFVALGVILFTGLSLWDSVNLALSAISTGGFSVVDGGVSSYHNLMLELLLIPIMIAGALPFRLYYLISENRRISLFGDEQIKLFACDRSGGYRGTGLRPCVFREYRYPDGTRAGPLYDRLRPDDHRVPDRRYRELGKRHPRLSCHAYLHRRGCGKLQRGDQAQPRSARFQGARLVVPPAFVSGKVLIPFKSEGRVIPRATAELETAKTLLVIILSVLVIFVSTLVVIQFHITTFPITDVLFDVISAFSTCGMTTGYVSSSMPALSKWVVYPRDVGLAGSK